MEVHDAFGVHLIHGKGKVRLLRIQVNICSDGHVRISINSLAWWEPGDEISADDLLRSFGYGNWECGRLRMRNRLKMLTLFAASDVLVDKGAHKWPLVVSFDEFQDEVAA